jgi:transcriptional repressor NrdR
VPVRCPACGAGDTRVVDSRDLDGSTTIRRRRACAACQARFTTYERVESARLTVVKRSGDREDFDRDKLAAGLEKALTRRPVPTRAAQALADAIEAELRGAGITEVTSEHLGRMALDRLRTLDEVAYLRFASVHQNIETLDQFKREVDTLHAQRARTAPGQTELALGLPPVPEGSPVATVRRRGRR